MEKVWERIGRRKKRAVVETCMERKSQLEQDKPALPGTIMALK